CQQTSPSDHYHIAKHPRASSDLTSWLTDIKDDDSAKKNFIPHLKDHLLARLCSLDYSGNEHSFSDVEQDLIVFANNKIHEHSIL
ncbi:hypothetical protein BDR03DRAFT_862394, partial [Suillus americanus]